MADASAHATVVVTNPQGLHARPAYLLVELAGKFQSRVELIKDGEAVDGKSILSILSLGAGEGTSLELVTCGVDAQEALRALVELFQCGFHEGGKVAEGA